MDKRAAFEAWRAERYAQTTSWCNELGEYPDEFTQGQWKAWKGALSAQPAASAEPSDTNILAEWAFIPNSGDMRVDLVAFARALLSRYGRPAGDAQPVAWVAADTLNSPHPTCISSLAYMSQLDRERGREYVPLYAAPVAAQAPTYVPAMGDAAEAYIKRVAPHAHRLPATLRWQDLYEAMLAAAKAPAADGDALREAVKTAYGYLWHVNNEPGTPNQYAPERAAYEARKVLRAHLTKDERGEGINAVRAAMQRTSGGDHA